MAVLTKLGYGTDSSSLTCTVFRVYFAMNDESVSSNEYITLFRPLGVRQLDRTTLKYQRPDESTNPPVQTASLTTTVRQGR